jgi:hypothetical protein
MGLEGVEIPQGRGLNGRVKIDFIERKSFLRCSAGGFFCTCSIDGLHVGIG